MQIERVAPSELTTLRKAVADKEEEVGKLSGQLETKEIEKQKLLKQVKKQSQHEEELEDRLFELTAAVAELKVSLMEAEDRQVRAKFELEDLKNRRAASPVPKAEPVCMNMKGNESKLT